MYAKSVIVLQMLLQKGGDLLSGKLKIYPRALILSGFVLLGTSLPYFSFEKGGKGKKERN